MSFVRGHVDRLHLKLTFTSIFVEECGATAEVSKKLLRDGIFVKKLNGHWQRKSVPRPSNVVLDDSRGSRLGPRFHHKVLKRVCADRKHLQLCQQERKQGRMSP